jgi:spoIIIJ-associated protein
MKRASDLDSSQGDGEERTETYSQYDEGAPEASTTRDAKSGSGAAGSAGRQADAVRGSLNENMEEAILYAKKYLEDLLSFFGLNTDVHATTEDNEVIELDIPSTHLNGFLIGQRGDTLRAVQFILSTALKNQDYSHTRVNVDVAGYKKQHNERVAKQAEDWFAEVRSSGQPKDLAPMSPSDRRVIHKAAEGYGLTTESVGEGRDRHIVIRPATGDEPKQQSPAEE